MGLGQFWPFSGLLGSDNKVMPALLPSTIPGTLAPTQITGDQNNYAPTQGYYSYELSSDAARSITGLSLGQSGGELIHLYNDGSFPISLPHLSGSSSAGNQFKWPSQKTFTLFPGYFILIRYSERQSKWLPVSGYPGPLPWIRLGMTAKQTFASSATPGKLSFDTINDKSPIWGADPTVPLTDLTMPYSGYFEIKANDLDWGDNAIAISTGVRKLGTELAAGAATRRQMSIMVGAGGAANNQSVQSGVKELYLAAGDTVAIIAAQTGGATLTSAVAILDVKFKYTEMGVYTPVIP